MIQAWTPGRVCLLGEHCDWAHGASLAAPLPLGIRAQLLQDVSHTGQLTIHSTVGDQQLRASYRGRPDRTPAARGPLRYAAAVLDEITHRGWGPVSGTLRLETTLPMGRGFSSSAALSVVVATVLARHAGVAPDPSLVADVAYCAERHRVGIHCGRLDPLACAFARPLLLEWPEPRLTPIEPPAALPLVVAAFPSPRDTPAILRALSDAYGGGDQRVWQTIDRWGELARRGGVAIAAGDLPRLGGLMNEAQELYEQTLADHLPALRAPGLRRICARMRADGALGAKFSGAGGDGSVVVLAANASEAARLRAELLGEGLTAWSASA